MIRPCTDAALRPTPQQRRRHDVIKTLSRPISAREKDLQPLTTSPFNYRRCERQDLNLHPFRDWILSPNGD